MKLPDIGSGLEARYQRLLIYKGFCTYRNVLIYPFKQNHKIATDIDIYAISYNENFHSQIINVECKGGDDVDIFDRIFWLSGVKKILNADRSILLLKKYTPEYIEFAQRLNIETISLTSLEELETIYNIQEDWWPGLSNYSIWDNVFSKIERYSKLNYITKDNISIIKDLYNTCKNESWKKFSYNHFNKICRLLVDLSIKSNNCNKDILSTNLLRIFYSLSFITLSHIFLFICHDLFNHSNSTREEYLKQKMTFGDQDQDYINKVINNMTNLVKAYIKEQGIMFTDRLNPLSNLKPPAYTDSIYQLIKKFYLSPEQTINMPYAAELNQFGFKSGIYSEVDEKVALGLQQLDLLKAFLIQDIKIENIFLDKIDTSVIEELSKIK